MTIKIEHNVTIRFADSGGSCGILEELEEIVHRLQQVGLPSANRKRKRRMITPKEQKILDDLNTETNRIAALVIDLRDNPPDDAEFNQRLTDIAAALQAVGAPPATV